MTTLVGLSGFARSGKDEAARALISIGWRRDAFADRLRSMLYSMNPYIPVWLESDLGGGVHMRRVKDIVDSVGWEAAKTDYHEIRSLLQRLGTEAGREVLGEQVWVDALFRKYTYGEQLVITDVRFTNEADMVRQLGGVMVRIDRPGVGPNTAPDGSVHKSDIALDDYDFDVRIANDGSITDLHRAVLGVVAVPAACQEVADAASLISRMKRLLPRQGQSVAVRS